MSLPNIAIADLGRYAALLRKYKYKTQRTMLLFVKRLARCPVCEPRTGKGARHARLFRIFFSCHKSAVKG